MPDRSQQRRANFFKDTRRDPEAHTVPDALEAQALTAIETNIRTEADTAGRPIDAAKVRQALAVAQRLIRQLPREQLQSIASSGGLLQSITAQSLAGTGTTAAGKTDPRALPDGSGAPRESGATLLRLGDGSLRGDSGARFNALAGEDRMSPAMAQAIAGARAEALRLGMPWAANHPDLLKLGPAAIKAIAETNLRETGYKALRNGAFYEAPDIVAFAKHAKLRGFDAEKAAKSTEALIQGLPPGEQQSTSRIMRDFDHAAAAHFANPSDAAAKARYEAAGRAQKQRMEDIAKRSEADRARVQRLEDDKRIQQEFRATTVGNEHTASVEHQRAEVRVQAAEVKEQAADVRDKAAAAKKTADLGDLDDPAPAKPENPQHRAEAAPAPGSAPATTTAAAPPADKAPAEKTQTAAAPPKPSAPKMA